MGIFICLTFFPSVHAMAGTQLAQMDMKGVCENLSPEMQQFANKLNMKNKMLFCSEFTDSQRTQAMQMAAGTGSYKNSKMSPNKSVETIAAKIK